MRSRYFQQKFKAARKANKKMSPDESEYFEDFLREERIVFLQGWRHTLLGSVCALPWTIWWGEVGVSIYYYYQYWICLQCFSLFVSSRHWKARFGIVRSLAEICFRREFETRLLRSTL